jgi:hypothetical protein
VQVTLLRAPDKQDRGKKSWTAPSAGAAHTARRAKICAGNDNEERIMISFSLITAGQLSAFLAVLQSNGFAEADFELQETEFDQQTAEVEARKGDVAVRSRLSEAVSAYPLGDGSDWVANFAADLESGRFGRPPRG